MAKVLSFSLSEEDAAQLQTLEKRMEAGSRSEVVRMALQFLRASQDELEGRAGDTHAVLVLVDAKHGHAGRLDEIAHEYEGIIVSSMHQVLHHECVEMWLLHGPGGRI
ncbi:MAG: ribbon-helix-helix protein, CopG family, partial [Candidatus Micrarchaeota archaeon]|nr:ribbon-helix-helix protein, CopG family [Candidatus Micrarchaeota archaeon]